MRTFILLLATAAFAQQDVGTNVRQPNVDFYDSISDYFRQSRRAVDLIAQKGMPDEEIPAVLYIARHSIASPNQVIDARKAGKPFADIAKDYNVKLEGADFVSEANIVFLAEYHGRTPAEVRTLRGKGVTFIDINQQFRRVGTHPTKKATQR